MALYRSLIRAAAWSLLVLLGWYLVGPVTSVLLSGYTQLFLAFGHRAQPLTLKAHLGGVLFLALFLAGKPRGQMAIVWAIVGVNACLVAQALTTAVLLLAGDADPEPFLRLARDLAIGVDKMTPLAAALILIPLARASHRGAAQVFEATARPRLSARRRARR
jgi:hypothetical protein